MYRTSITSFLSHCFIVLPVFSLRCSSDPPNPPPTPPLRTYTPCPESACDRDDMSQLLEDNKDERINRRRSNYGSSGGSRLPEVSLEGAYFPFPCPCNRDELGKNTWALVSTKMIIRSAKNPPLFFSNASCCFCSNSLVVTTN